MLSLKLSLLAVARNVTTAYLGELRATNQLLTHVAGELNDRHLILLQSLGTYINEVYQAEDPSLEQPTCGRSRFAAIPQPAVQIRSFWRLQMQCTAVQIRKQI